MRIIYYVIQPQLQEVDEFQETNGWKSIRAYQIVDNQLKDIGDFEVELSENTEDELLSYIMEDIDEDEIIKLVQL